MEEDQRDIKAMKTAPIWRKRPSQGGCSRTSCVEGAAPSEVAMSFFRSSASSILVFDLDLCFLSFLASEAGSIGRWKV